MSAKRFLQIALPTVLAFSMQPLLGQTPAQKTAPVVAATSVSVASNPIIQTLDHELKRSMTELKKASGPPLYYLAYRLYDGRWDAISASRGALDKDRTGSRQWRTTCVDLRVGSPHLDNTHYLRSQHSTFGAYYDNTSGRDSITPIENAGLPLQECLWLKTDQAFKDAQRTFYELAASNEIYTVEEDKSGDFTLQAAHSFQSQIKEFPIDIQAWRDKVRRLSEVFCSHPNFSQASVSFTPEETTRYFVNSENSKIIEQHLSYLFNTSASTLADDGMNIWLYDAVEVPDPNLLPDEAALKARVEKLAKSVEELRKAPAAEPYVGPAILSGKAASVFFHETLGHRIEGVHQKSEAEGKTFAKKIGTQIMPSFISVIDDPGLKTGCNQWLNGHYTYDDEGVPAQKVSIVKNGVLTNFLLGRNPVQGFRASNGHGRSAAGWNPCARQANLVVIAEKSKQYSPKVLRQLLIAEAKRQHKPYGLFFDQIQGGYTQTARGSEQTYVIQPLRVFKVFVDGRPDQLIRGADIVGTPLAALEHIMAAGTECDVFNGRCGRESGHIPVSALAPSLLLQSIEIKRTSKSFEKPPILPDPTIVQNPAPTALQNQ